MKGGGFWTGAEGLLGSHSQGFTRLAVRVLLMQK